MFRWVKELFYIVNNYKKNRASDTDYIISLLLELESQKANKTVNELQRRSEEENIQDFGEWLRRLNEKQNRS